MLWISDVSMDKNQANNYFNQPAKRIPSTKYSFKYTLKGQQKNRKLNEQSKRSETRFASNAT